MKRNFLAAALTVITLSGFSQQPGGPQPAGRLFDEAIYRRARENLKGSRLEDALKDFRDMISVTPKEVWTAQAILVCDEKDLEARVESLNAAASQATLVIKRPMDSKVCYRVCAGLFTSRSEASNFARSLPPPFKEAKPYPLLLVSNGTYSKAAFEPGPAPAAIEPKAAAAEKAPATAVESPAPAAANPAPSPAPKNEESSDPATNLFVNGVAAFSRNDLKEAERCFKQSIIMRPERFEAYNNLGAALLQDRKYDEAREVLEKAVSIQPGYASARANLSGAYWYLGRRDDAVKEAERAYRLDSHNVRYSVNLASFLCEEGRYNEAMTYIGVAKIVSPDNQDVLALERKIQEKLPAAKEQPAAAQAAGAPPPDAGKVQSEPPAPAPEASPEAAKQDSASGKKDEDAKASAGDKKPKRRFLGIFRRKPKPEKTDDKSDTQKDKE